MSGATKQKQYLTSKQADDAMTGATLSENLEHASLVSPLLEASGYCMPSQFALLGEVQLPYNPERTMSDARVILNTNVPFSAFICGLQGSGKSHTTSCIIEICSLNLSSLGRLRSSVSTLVLHFNEYSSNASSQPSEAAFLSSLLPQYNSQRPNPIPLMYSHIPNVEHMMLSLMSMSQGDGTPLYMAQVLRVLREMAMHSGERTQTPFLAQRLDLLDSYLDPSSYGASDYFVDGGVIILDLSCPFVDRDIACILFRITIDLFLHAHSSRGKIIVADEAHKESTISPKLIDLCSITIIHRFTSPDWYRTVCRHIPIENNFDNSKDLGLKPLYQISSHRVGEAIVFAPSAHLLNVEHMELDT
ncbi:hypothetical protein BDV19DRAFT_383053 [Aspergillus venezuelensis]